jgi:hypothetical protein
MRKLTLSAEPAVIEAAKKVARPQPSTKLPPKTRRASGLVRLPKGKTDRQLIEEAMAERHLR